MHPELPVTRADLEQTELRIKTYIQETRVVPGVLDRVWNAWRWVKLITIVGLLAVGLYVSYEIYQYGKRAERAVAALMHTQQAIERTHAALERSHAMLNLTREHVQNLAWNITAQGHAIKGMSDSLMSRGSAVGSIVTDGAKSSFNRLLNRDATIPVPTPVPGQE